jgi:hypothetical protein
MEIHIEKEELASCIRETVDYMFDQVLKRKKPETITIKTGDQDYTSLGTYNSGLSDEDKFYITLSDKLIHEYQDRKCQFRITLVHELMHAADQPLIQKYAFYKYIILTLRKRYSFKRLQWLLWALHHFRVEGIADLCVRLLWQRKEFQPKSRTDLRFCRYRAQLDSQFNTDSDAEHFTQLMEKVIDAGEKLPKELSKEIRGRAYDYGCAIVLRALRNLQLISQTEEQQIDAYIRTGGRQMLVKTGELSLFPEEKSELDEEVIGRVLNTCLSLNLPMFLEGLLLDREGKPLVPVTPLLTLCGDAQGYRRDDRIALFAKLLNSPQRTVTEFNKAMKVLAGRPMPEKSMIRAMGEIHEYPGWPTYLGFNDKIDRLYASYWEHKAAGRQELAQVANHALHYFFRVKDMIGDFVPAFGFVDDLLVVDMALDILDS